MTSEKIEASRRAMYEISEKIAPTWERRRADVEAASAPVRQWMIRKLAPRPGDVVLELAAGVGDTGFEAATLVGENGRLISSDFSPAMLDAARRRGAELGISNVEYRQIDAERIDLDSDSVDGVLCRFGYMLMDPAAALAETRRVLRPGGIVALATWGALEHNPFFSTVAMALIQRGHLPPPDPAEPGPFALASAEATAALLAYAGFGEVRAEEVPVRFAVPDIEEYVRLVADTSGPIALALRDLPDSELDWVRTQSEAALKGFVTDGGYEIPGVALCAAAS